MLNNTVGILICICIGWLVFRIIIRQSNFISDYDEAELQDLKEYKEGMTLEETHKNRDKVLKKARMD